MNCENCSSYIKGRSIKATWMCRDCIRYAIVHCCSWGDYYVYQLYDKQDRLVYVGMTKNLLTRFKHHTKDKVFFSMEAVASFSTAADAKRFEASLIREVRPLYNKVYVLSEGKSTYPKQ